MVRRVVLAGLIVMLGASPARAARRLFVWSYDADVDAKRIVELESWIFEEIEDPGRSASVLWAPVAGLTDRLQLSLPVELNLGTEGGASTQLEAYGVELRWRLTTPDPVEAGRFNPLIRVAAKRLLADDDDFELEGDLVLAITVAPRLIVVIDAGTEIETEEPTVVGVGGVGASYALNDDLRLGAEVVTEIDIEPSPDDPAWLAAGPELAFTHGRLWVTAGTLFGIAGASKPDLLARLLWGIAF